MRKWFKKDKEKRVEDEVLFTWLLKRLDSNLLRWGGYKTKEDYEHEEGHEFNKERFIKENKNELQKIYLLRTDPNYAHAHPIGDSYKCGGKFSRGGTTKRSNYGERPLSAIKRDRKYTSDEEWEERYKRKRTSAVTGYSHHKQVKYKKTTTKKIIGKPFVYTIGGL